MNNLNIKNDEISWIPKYFFLTKRGQNHIQGFVHSEEEVHDLIQLLSKNTHCHFSQQSLTNKVHPFTFSARQINTEIREFSEGHFLNRKVSVCLYGCNKCHSQTKYQYYCKRKQKKNNDSLMNEDKLLNRCSVELQEENTNFTQNTDVNDKNITANVCVSKIYLYLDYDTLHKSIRQTQKLRNLLLEQLKSHPDEVVTSTCFKVTLPLRGAHKLHVIDDHDYWVTICKDKIRKRAEALIKQGLCHRHVLRDMLNSFIDNELSRTDFVSNIQIEELYPKHNDIINYINKYLKKCCEVPKEEINIIKQVKDTYIKKIRDEAIEKLPWLPSYFKVTEVTEDSVSGWIKTFTEFQELKQLCEYYTKSSLEPRKYEHSSGPHRDNSNKIHFSLAPIPINVHPFKLKKIHIYSCKHDKSDNATEVENMGTNNGVFCKAKIIAFQLNIFTEYILPRNIAKLLQELRSRLRKSAQDVTISERIFLTLPLANAHQCHQINGTDFSDLEFIGNMSQLSSNEDLEEIYQNEGFDIVYNSCIVGDNSWPVYTKKQNEFNDYQKESIVKDDKQLMNNISVTIEDDHNNKNLDKDAVNQEIFVLTETAHGEPIVARKGLHHSVANNISSLNVTVKNDFNNTSNNNFNNEVTTILRKIDKSIAILSELRTTINNEVLNHVDKSLALMFESIDNVAKKVSLNSNTNVLNTDSSRNKRAYPFNSSRVLIKIPKY